jgi:hypothetical protein
VVDLAVDGHINSYVAENSRLATQSMTRVESTSLQAIFFVFIHLAEAIGVRHNPFTGKVAFHCLHLATTTASPATAYRINIDS